MKFQVIFGLALAQVPLLMWSDTTENLLKLPCLSQTVIVDWPSFNPTKVGSAILSEFSNSKNQHYIPRINDQELRNHMQKCSNVVEISINNQNLLDMDQELKSKLRELNLDNYVVMLHVLLLIGI